MTVKEPLTPTQQAVAIRRLDAELGIDPPHSGAKGLLLGAAICAAVFAVAMAVYMPLEPGMRAYGRVEGVSLYETDVGSGLVARVQTGEERGLVPVPAAAMCAAGDRIELVRRRTLVNVSYRLGLGGCTRVR